MKVILQMSLSQKELQNIVFRSWSTRPCSTPSRQGSTLFFIGNGRNEDECTMEEWQHETIEEKQFVRKEE